MGYCICGGDPKDKSNLVPADFIIGPTGFQYIELRTNGQSPPLQREEELQLPRGPFGLQGSLDIVGNSLVRRHEGTYCLLLYPWPICHRLLCISLSAIKSPERTRPCADWLALLPWLNPSAVLGPSCQFLKSSCCTYTGTTFTFTYPLRATWHIRPQTGTTQWTSVPMPLSGVIIIVIIFNKELYTAELVPNICCSVSLCAWQFHPPLQKLVKTAFQKKKVHN